MNYQQTVDFLYNALPFYQRDGKAAYKADLGNIIELSKMMGNPHQQLKFVHIAGTNGKGSVCHMAASICQEAGIKTALYTSPHLTDFRERIKINGAMIQESEVVEFVKKYKEEFTQINASFFEWTLAMAFHYFHKQKVDLVILETGMGGRLDSTNIVTPLVSVITSIGLDHTLYLGDTLEKIAWEKAGIIKSGVPVVTGEIRPEALNVIEKKAEELKSEHIKFEEKENFKTDLMGRWQQKNCSVSEKVSKVLQKHFPVIKEEHIIKGLSKVKSNTGLRARFEQLRKEPLVICDTAHNEEAIKEVLSEIKNHQFKKLRMVLGFVEDKAIEKIISLLPKDAQYYICAPDIPRARPSGEVYEIMQREGFSCKDLKSCIKAYETAEAQSVKEDLIFIGGSTFVVAELIKDF